MKRKVPQDFLDDEAEEDEDVHDDRRGGGGMVFDEEEEEEGEPAAAPVPALPKRDLEKSEMKLLRHLVEHAAVCRPDMDEDDMGKLVSLVFSFGNFTSKQAFRFIVKSCSAFATGSFLAQVQSAGMKLKSKYVIQLVEAGATDKDDLMRKVVDLIEHHVLDITDPDHIEKIASVGAESLTHLEDKVQYTVLLGECCRTKQEFVNLLEPLSQGMMGHTLTSFLTQVAKHDFFLDLKGDLKEVTRTHPELKALWVAVEEHQAKEEQDMDEEGNLKDFVVSDGYASMDSNASDSLPSTPSTSDDEGGGKEMTPEPPSAPSPSNPKRKGKRQKLSSPAQVNGMGGKKKGHRGGGQQQQQEEEAASARAGSASPGKRPLQRIRKSSGK